MNIQIEFFVKFVKNGSTLDARNYQKSHFKTSEIKNKFLFVMVSAPVPFCLLAKLTTLNFYHSYLVMENAPVKNAN